MQPYGVMKMQKERHASPRPKPKVAIGLPSAGPARRLPRRPAPPIAQNQRTRWRAARRRRV